MTKDFPQRPVFDFAVIVIFIVIINIPFFIHPLYPMHDSTYILSGIYHFYSQFFYYSQLAQWSPYVLGGEPSSYTQITSISPVNYLAGFVAKFLNITDVLFIYTISTALEELILAGGIFHFVRSTTQNRNAALFAAIATVLSCAPFYQPFFNLRLFYLLPWSFYFIWKAIKKNQPENIWLAAGLVLLTGIGNPPYLMIPIMLIVTLFYLVLCLPHNIKTGLTLPCKPSRKNVLSFLTVFIAIALFFIYLKGLSSISSLTAMGRDDGGKVNLETFLLYSGHMHPALWLYSLLLRMPLFPAPYKDVSVYMGIPTVIFFFMAFFRLRCTTLRTLLIMTVFVLLLSFEGIFQRLSFYLPLMCYYRHSGNLLAVSKVFFIMVSGWGFAFFFTKIIPHTNKLQKIILSIAFLALILDLLIFQFSVYKEASAEAVHDKNLYSTLHVQKPPYPSYRSPAPITKRDRNAFRLLQASKLKKLYFYSSEFNFFQFAPCIQNSRNDWMIKGIQNLYNVPFVMTAINGCETSLLKLTTNIQYMSEESFLNQALEKNDLLKKWHEDPVDNAGLKSNLLRTDLAKTLIITSPEAEQIAKLSPTDKPGEIQVIDFHLNGITLQTNVSAKKGAWLYYADAHHPGWQAYIDGKPTPIYKAYAAFKTVFVPPGQQTVRFVFFNGLHTILTIWIAITSAVAGLLLIITSIKAFLKPTVTEPEM